MGNNTQQPPRKQVSCCSYSSVSRYAPNFLSWFRTKVMRVWFDVSGCVVACCRFLFTRYGIRSVSRSSQNLHVTVKWGKFHKISKFHWMQHNYFSFIFDTEFDMRNSSLTCAISWNFSFSERKSRNTWQQRNRNQLSHMSTRLPSHGTYLPTRLPVLHGRIPVSRFQFLQESFEVVVVLWRKIRSH